MADRNSVGICTVLNHVDESEAFWTVFAVPARPLGPKTAVGEVGTGDTEQAAIADYRPRASLGDDVTVEITRRDNVNIDIHEGQD